MPLVRAQRLAEVPDGAPGTLATTSDYRPSSRFRPCFERQPGITVIGLLSDLLPHGRCGTARREFSSFAPPTQVRGPTDDHGNPAVRVAPPRGTHPWDAVVARAPGGISAW